MINIKLPSIFLKKDNKGKHKNKKIVKRCDRCQFYKHSSAKYGTCSNPKSHIVTFAYEEDSKTLIQVQKYSVCKHFKLVRNNGL